MKTTREKIKKILDRTWANKPIKVEKCPMILDDWGTHTIGRGGDKVCCGACGKWFVTPKKFTEEMKIDALLHLLEKELGDIMLVAKVGSYDCEECNDTFRYVKKKLSTLKNSKEKG